jgi:hypothetical protein
MSDLCLVDEISSSRPADKFLRFVLVKCHLLCKLYTPTGCALGFAASNCRSTYCKMPPLA